MRPFVAKFHDITPHKDSGKFLIKLDNMLYKKKGSIACSFLDLKMGTDTCLKSRGSESYYKYVLRDFNTSSSDYGFRLTGYNITNK